LKAYVACSTRLLIYETTIAIAYPLIPVPYSSMTVGVIGKGWKPAEMRIEYIVVREAFLNTGRMISILIFIGAIYFFPAEKSIPILLLILGLGHTLAAFLLLKLKPQ